MCTCNSIHLYDRRYTTIWRNVFIMQLSTERHVSTLQICKPQDPAGNTTACTLSNCHYFIQPDDGPVGSKHVAQLIVA